MSEDLLGLEGEGLTLSGRDKRIMLTLMELEELRGEQVDMKEEIQVIAYPAGEKFIKTHFSKFFGAKYKKERTV